MEQSNYQNTLNLKKILNFKFSRPICQSSNIIGFRRFCISQKHISWCSGSLASFRKTAWCSCSCLRTSSPHHWEKTFWNCWTRFQTLRPLVLWKGVPNFFCMLCIVTDQMKQKKLRVLNLIVNTNWLVEIPELVSRTKKSQ